jgi:hypothetical protein
VTLRLVYTQSLGRRTNELTLLPDDVEFLGDHHRQGGTQALSDFRLLTADDHGAIRIDLHEEANLAFAFFLESEGGQTDDEATGRARTGNQELSTCELVSLRCRVHDSSPAAISAAR